jgi:LemA protein
MSSQQIVALVAVAILVFWTLGAYNRLVALRNKIGRAWQRVDEALRQRSSAAEPLAAALAQPLAAEHGALLAWSVDHANATRAAAAMAAGPVLQDRAAEWVAAESALAASSSRVFALLDQHPELAASDTVAPLAAAWRDGQAGLPFARQMFNDAAATYDEALAMFPTRLLSLLFGFKPAGRL